MASRDVFFNIPNRGICPLPVSGRVPVALRENSDPGRAWTQFITRAQVAAAKNVEEEKRKAAAAR